MRRAARDDDVIRQSILILDARAEVGVGDVARDREHANVVVEVTFDA